MVFSNPTSQAWFKFKAANTLSIPCLGLAMMDFAVEGHNMGQRGGFVAKDDCLSNSFLSGVNVIQAVYEVVFKNPGGPKSFSMPV